MSNLRAEGETVNDGAGVPRNPVPSFVQHSNYVTESLVVRFSASWSLFLGFDKAATIFAVSWPLLPPSTKASTCREQMSTPLWQGTVIISAWPACQ